MLAIKVSVRCCLLVECSYIGKVVVRKIFLRLRVQG